MPKIRSGDIAVDGLRELAKALKQVDPELQKELRGVNRAATAIVATAAQSKARSLGGPAAKAAPSIKSVGGIRSAGVAFGGAAYPFAMGAEFGANQNRQRTRTSGSYIGYRQFDDWRGNTARAGYFIYPSIRSTEDRVLAQYQQGVDDLIRRLF